MTLPPPPSGNGGSPQYGGSPDPFGPPPQQPGAGSYGGPPQQGGPPQHHAPAWQPPQQQQPPHQQGPQQQPPSWAPQPGGQPPIPPKKGGGVLKWGLIGVALLAIIGVTVALTITFTKGSGDEGDGGNGNNPGTTQASGTSGPSPSPGGNSEIASANDTGPATIITEDPTCTAWGTTSNALSDAQQKAGWVDHDYKVPVSAWTPELRSMYETVGKALTTAADQTVSLSKKTPHRLMRELYAQFIAYSRSFVNTLDSYAEKSNYLSTAAIAAASVATNICEAIKYKSAEARGPFVPDVSPPSNVAPVGDLNSPSRITDMGDTHCGQLESLYDAFVADSNSYTAIDSSLTFDKWNDEQRAIVNSVVPVMQKYADDLEGLGRGSANPLFGDLTVYSAQYWRAYAGALPNYTVADAYLGQTAGHIPWFIVQACLALGN